MNSCFNLIAKPDYFFNNTSYRKYELGLFCLKTLVANEGRNVAPVLLSTCAPRAISITFKKRPPWILFIPGSQLID